MSYIFDKEKITKLIANFYISTGIAVTLYDSAMEIIATSAIYSEYCNCIRSKRKCVENCDKSNFIHMKQAKETRSTVFYTCHAGLMETITPIFYEDTLIAYMQTGQFRDEEHVYSQEENLLNVQENYSFPLPTLTEFYKKTPIISKEKLQATQSLMDILIKSFWTNGLIFHNRSMLSVKIEQFIVEHLTEKIYISELCNTFFLSKNALYALFKSEFNTTIGEFILLKRLQRSRELLNSSMNLSIAEIAERCGFNDYNYFIRVFKKHYGISPLQHRKQFIVSKK